MKGKLTIDKQRSGWRGKSYFIGSILDGKNFDLNLKNQAGYNRQQMESKNKFNGICKSVNYQNKEEEHKKRNLIALKNSTK